MSTTPASTPRTEINDIFREIASDYLKKNADSLTGAQKRAIRDISQCRTIALGGHVQECDTCGSIANLYNSCSNRHCPKCGTLNKIRWLESREADLMRVQYFHVVFTMPASIASIALQNPNVVYDILFRASSSALLDVAANPKYLGAQIGFTSVLHTWGQNLMHHPHVHCLVPGGGLSPDRTTWVPCREDFFLPVRVLSSRFKNLFIQRLVEARKSGKLCFHGSIEHLADPAAFDNLIQAAFQQKWVVYAKPPLGNPEQVLDYLARYTHRVAISNNRIIGHENSRVTFTWKDYKNGGAQKNLTLNDHEFMRRFLLHILPPRFTKCRHYGILANRTRKVNIALCRQILGNQPEPPSSEPRHWTEIMQDLLGHPVDQCPQCRIGRLSSTRVIPPCRSQPIASPVCNHDNAHKNTS